MIFGAAPLPFSIPPALKGQLLVGDFIYSKYRLVMLAVAAAAVAALWLLLQRTPFGRVVRAGVQNPDMVAALGISLQPYMSAVVAISVALAALAGVLLAPITGVHPAMGAEILTAAFVVVVIGGLGSFWGVVWAALIVGVVRGLTVYFYPGRGRSVDVPADGARAAGPPARPLRRAHPALRMMRAAAPQSLIAAAAHGRAAVRAAGRRPDAHQRDRRRDLRRSPAWRSTSWSGTPGSCRSATARGSASARTPPR